MTDDGAHYTPRLTGLQARTARSYVGEFDMIFR